MKSAITMCQVAVTVPISLLTHSLVITITLKYHAVEHRYRQNCHQTSHHHKSLSSGEDRQSFSIDLYLHRKYGLLSIFRIDQSSM
jgi:hypothetical protein